MQNKKLPELLAPAGNMAKMKIALAHGADAVYLGIPDFSLRVRINDFTIETIKEAVEHAHSLNKKAYVTINIFAHNHHFKKLPMYVKKLKTYQVDALIISDPGILSVVKDIWPKAEMHLSTQANCTNWQSAKFWFEQGVKRVILGRETTLDEIKEIHKKVPKLELEYFVHGAMCMAYSGRCFLSKYYLGRSANLGDCVQPCRWEYNIVEITEEKRPSMPMEIVEEEHGSYILNSKDMCLIKHVRELQKAGIVSFKIEGRAKSVYYQAVVAGAYRKAINTINSSLKKSEQDKIINDLYQELETKLVHRGYTDGFLLGGKSDQNINDSHQPSKWEFCGLVVETLHRNVSNVESPHQHQSTIKVHNTLKINDQIEIVRPGYDIIKMRIKKMINKKNSQEIEEAHGGGSGHVVVIETNEEIPENSVIRRVL